MPEQWNQCDNIMIFYSVQIPKVFTGRFSCFIGFQRRNPPMDTESNWNYQLESTRISWSSFKLHVNINDYITTFHDELLKSFAKCRYHLICSVSGQSTFGFNIVNCNYLSHLDEECFNIFINYAYFYLYRCAKLTTALSPYMVSDRLTWPCFVWTVWRVFFWGQYPLTSQWPIQGRQLKCGSRHQMWQRLNRRKTYNSIEITYM